MEDEYDIYGDLEGFEEAAAQDNKVVQELNAQIAELREQIAEKEHEKQDTIARNTILLENISSLLVTAKAELKRKDAVIADIRRERDNVAFRRKRPVKRHDQGTQTTLVRLLSREVQTEVGEEPGRIKREQQTEWHRERKRVEDDHRRSGRDRFKVKERVPVRERLGSRPVMARQEMKHAYGRRARGRTHEEERERERQARRGPRSPDAGRHPVRFRSPVRVKAEESSVPDSASDIELSRAFIPMNRKELDRYVKEIGREQSRSPVVVGGSKQDKTSKSLEEVSGADLWDKRPRKKSKTPKKHRKQASKTPVKQKSPAIIQSDEIGTTACGSSVLSPVKSEDIEQRMSALHGHPPLPEPPELVIPPPEPPIIEQVPELPLEDEAKLNDSRELKIIESCDELGTPKGEPTVEDVRNLSAETVIERSRVEDEEDLEDGEIITPVSSPATPAKENIENAKRNAKIAIAVAQLAQETRNKLEQQEAEINSEQKVKEKSTKLKRKRADRSPQVEPNPVQVPAEVVLPAKEPTPEQDKTKHKRNLNGAFELPTAPETSASRRNTFSGTAMNDKGKRKQRLSEPGSAVAAAVPKMANKKTEVLHKLFGSDDDGSFVVAVPPEEQTAVAVAHGKRKRTESAGEVMDSKKSRKVEVVDEAPKETILTEEKRSAGTDESEEVGEVCKDADESIVEDESELDSKEERQVQKAVEVEENLVDEPVAKDENETLKSDSAVSIESKDVTAESETIAAIQSAETLKSDSATSVESESSASLNRTAQSEENEIASENEQASNGTEVPENEVELHYNQDVTQKEKIDESQIEQVVAANVEEDKRTPALADTTNHPHDAIVVSNKYCEYRIEDDNEAETTFYVTRKKKKKTKSKSRNASLNASGAN